MICKKLKFTSNSLQQFQCHLRIYQISILVFFCYRCTRTYHPFILTGRYSITVAPGHVYRIKIMLRSYTTGGHGRGRLRVSAVFQCKHTKKRKRFLLHLLLVNVNRSEIDYQTFERHRVTNRIQRLYHVPNSGNVQFIKI